MGLFQDRLRFVDSVGSHRTLPEELPLTIRRLIVPTVAAVIAMHSPQVNAQSAFPAPLPSQAASSPFPAPLPTSRRRPQWLSRRRFRRSAPAARSRPPAQRRSAAEAVVLVEAASAAEVLAAEAVAAAVVALAAHGKW